MITDDPNLKAAPFPTIRRLPTYLSLLRRLRAEGLQTVSGTHIAEELGLDSIQVRKDFAYTGMVGKPGVGFDVPTVIHLIEAFLGWDNTTDAFLVGAGSLGTALMGYEGFRRYGLDIIAAFDNDPAKTGLNIHGKQVLPLDKLPELVRRLHVRLGIITVPGEAAQQVADQLIDAGIGAIWNFAPAAIKVPATVTLQNTELAAELAVLSVTLSRTKHKAAPVAVAGPLRTPPTGSSDESKNTICA